MNSSFIMSVNDGEFDDVVSGASVPVLVEFWQPGCAHCQALMRELEIIQAQLKHVLLIVKMNVQENYLIPADLEITSLPALALYLNGEFQVFIGGIGKKKELLQQLMPWIKNRNVNP